MTHWGLPYASREPNLRVIEEEESILRTSGWKRGKPLEPFVGQGGKMIAGFGGE